LAIFATQFARASDAETPLTDAQIRAIDEAMNPFETSRLVLNFKNISDRDYQGVVDNLPASDDGVVVEVTPDLSSTATTTRVQVIYPDGSAVLDSNGEPVTLSVPQGVAVKVAQNEDEVKAFKGSFVVLLEKILDHTSVGVGVTKVDQMPPSVWYQKGLPYRLTLVSPSGEIQFSIPAQSIGFLSKSKSSFVKHLSFDVGYVYFGTFRSSAVATGSGAADPNTNPVYKWTGSGNEQGVFFSLREDLPFGLYISAGVLLYKNHWKMQVSQACESPHCPWINQTVYGPANTQVGERLTLGHKISQFGSIECSLDSSSDNENMYPPIWHNQAYTCDYVQRL
jgi:hypothetical protein